MFNEKLKKCREEKSLTQEDVAAFFEDDCTRQSVSKWERGDAFPEVEKLLVLSAKLDISLDELFSDEMSYLKKDKPTINPLLEKYPGIPVFLETFAKTLKDKE